MGSIADFPFTDGFEKGAMGTGWSSYTTNEGRVQVSTSHPYVGSYSLLLDDSVAGSQSSYAGAVLTIDLDGESDVTLDIWWREFGDEDHPGDGVFISDDYGRNWHQIFSFNGGPLSFQNNLFDLDQAASSNGLTLNDHFQILFQFNDNYPIPSDGYAIDNVRLYAGGPSVTPTPTPSQEGFDLFLPIIKRPQTVLQEGGNLMAMQHSGATACTPGIHLGGWHFTLPEDARYQALLQSLSGLAALFLC